MLGLRERLDQGFRSENVRSQSCALVLDAIVRKRLSVGTESVSAAFPTSNTNKACCQALPRPVLMHLPGLRQVMAERRVRTRILTNSRHSYCLSWYSRMSGCIQVTSRCTLSCHVGVQLFVSSVSRRCGRKNHKTENCSTTVSKVKCFSCGELGHISAHCSKAYGPVSSSGKRKQGEKNEEKI